MGRGVLIISNNLLCGFYFVVCIFNNIFNDKLFYCGNECSHCVEIRLIIYEWKHNV